MNLSRKYIRILSTKLLVTRLSYNLDAVAAFNQHPAKKLIIHSSGGRVAVNSCNARSNVMADKTLNEIAINVRVATN